MSFCSKCGAQIAAENIQFCPSCGAAAANGGYQPPQSQPSYGGVPPYGAVNVSPAVRTIRELGSSPLYLIAVIAFSISALLTLMSSFASPLSAISGLIAQIASQAGMSSFEILELYSIMQEYEGIFVVTRVISTIFSLIPTLIIALGLWMIFSSSRKPDYVKLSTAGFTVIKVMTIISLICSCVSALIIFIVMIIAAIASSAGFDSGSLTAVFAVGIFVTLFVGILIIIYYCKVVKSLNCATRSVLDNNPYPNASRFVGIICFVAAVFSFIGIFGSIIQFSFTGVLHSLCAVIETAAFGLLIFKYRSSMLAAYYETHAPNNINNGY